MQRKLISFDWAIKNILRDKANFEILEGFLSELLFEDVEILEILESESNRETENEKSNRLDVKVKTAGGQIILIEVQFSRELDYLQRMLFAASKTVTEHFLSGKEYAGLSRVVSVNILYFDFGTGKDYVYKGVTNFTGMHGADDLGLDEIQKTLFRAERPANLFPEYYIIKVGNFNDSALDTLDEWIDFLKNERIREKPQAKGLKKASEALDFLKMSDSERATYDRHKENLSIQASLYNSSFVVGQMKGEKTGIAKGKIEGEKVGIVKGKIEGKERRNVEIAVILQKKGMATKEIAEITGLSAEEIDKL